VILGAGFDCRAYRMPLLVRTRVFEVDQASTLAAKRRRLGQVLPGLPPYVRFVEVDFNRQHPEDALEAAGYRGDLRTCFIWEGVTNYLTAVAVDGTLRWIGSAVAGSRVLFTYVQRSALAGTAGGKRLGGLLQRVGEPWTFGFDPVELPAYLAERGLRLIEDIGSREYRARYMRPDGLHMCGFEFYHVADAEVDAR
jgi:methyltransferase (TIGR00027 family)